MLHLLFDPQNKIRLLKPTICQLQQAELVGPARASRFPSSHLGVHFVLFVALLSARTRLLFCVSAPQIVRRHSVTYALSISPLLNPRFGRRHTPSARVTRIPAQITIPRQPWAVLRARISLGCRLRLREIAISPVFVEPCAWFGSLHSVTGIT